MQGNARCNQRASGFWRISTDPVQAGRTLAPLAVNSKQARGRRQNGRDPCLRSLLRAAPLVLREDPRNIGLVELQGVQDLQELKALRDLATGSYYNMPRMVKLRGASKTRGVNAIGSPSSPVRTP